MLRNPPPLVETEEEAEEAAVEDSQAGPAAVEAGCGCSAVALPVSAGMAYLIPWWWTRRRNTGQA